MRPTWWRPLATWHWQIVAAPAYLAARAPIDSPHQLAENGRNHPPIHAILLRGEERHVLEIERSMLCSRARCREHADPASRFGFARYAAAAATRRPTAHGRLCAVLPDWDAALGANCTRRRRTGCSRPNRSGVEPFCSVVLGLIDNLLCPQTKRPSEKIQTASSVRINPRVCSQFIVANLLA